MGKGEIIEDKEDGLYSVKVLLDREKHQSRLSYIDDKIAVYQDIYAGLDDGAVKDTYALRIASLQKFKEWMEKVFSVDPTYDLWCADYTEGLSGEVGLIEIPGERQAQNVHPGYDGAAGYNGIRDGKLTPAMGTTPAGVFYNLAMKPGWQKFKPTFRYGTITSIDYDNDRCNVDLDPAASTIKGINVNQAESLENVSIEYMDCNAAAFEEGDAVIVKFESQNWANPKVIGFKDNPVPCGRIFIHIRLRDTVYYADKVIVFNVSTGSVANVPGVEFPCDDDDENFLAWLSTLENINSESKALFDSVSVQRDIPPDDVFVPETEDEILWDSELKTYFPDIQQNRFAYDDNSSKCGVGAQLPGHLGYVSCLSPIYSGSHARMSDIEFEYEIQHAINGYVYKNANDVGGWTGKYSAVLNTSRVNHFDYAAFARAYKETGPFGQGGPEYDDQAIGLMRFINPLNPDGLELEFTAEISDPAYCFTCHPCGGGSVIEFCTANWKGIADWRINQRLTTGYPWYYGALSVSSFVPPYPKEEQHQSFCDGVALQIYLYNHAVHDESYDLTTYRLVYANYAAWDPPQYHILGNSQVQDGPASPESFTTPLFSVNAGFLRNAEWETTDFISEMQRSANLEEALAELYESVRIAAEAEGLPEYSPVNMDLRISYFEKISD